MSAFLSVLRIAGPEFKVEEFLGRYPRLQPDAIWRRGESKRGRAPAANSGFTITLGEDDTSLSGICRFCESKGGRRVVAEALECGADVLLDVATEVGSDKHYVSSVVFTPRQLCDLGALGITLVVSGYPVSPETAGPVESRRGVKPRPPPRRAP